ncbi:hypothetical protein OS493_005982 [Desmophyllum pertusum]|uniref:Uncharacterized protein n=1 Tax=Desmophyllum pertusum TaxID=174260 RepID=A0A9X0CIG8_9CNID|nr:hypothetical protein OS493_005982 [Desmophyllum pertusum]
MLLNHYLQQVLRMPPQNSLRSLKAQQCCQLRHVISLWRLLSLERARILMRRGEDPFEQIANTYKQVMDPKQMMKFSNGMMRVNLARFVSEVLELILLNLRGDAVRGEEEMSLSSYVQWHLDNKEHEPIPGLDELPPDVQLKHVINAWRTSVETMGQLPRQERCCFFIKLLPRCSSILVFLNLYKRGIRLSLH